MRRNLLHAAWISALLFIGAGCSLGGAPKVQITPVTLEYWRTDDSPAAFQPVIDSYRKIRPNVTINYKSVPASDYERALLEAFAENRGPDMFSIPYNWLHGWKGKILPLPKETVIPTLAVDDAKKLTAINQKSETLNLIQLRNDFVEGVATDVVMPVPDEKTGLNGPDGIWALPYSYDTLALYYNKSLLKKAGLEKPPASWRELQEQAAKLTIVAEDGTIKQSGAAIGGSKNVTHSPDLLAAIMMQDGAIMADANGYPRFNLYGENRSGAYTPGVEALMFYQSFTFENGAAYVWNEKMPSSLDAFVAGRTAFYFGYPNDAHLIKERAPGLSFGVSALPQMNPGAPKNIANYPVEVVSKKSSNSQIAWDFLQFASRAEHVESWLTATKRPTALRSLIAAQFTDPEIGPFAGQILTGRSWYKGTDWATTEAAFHALIDWRPTQERPEYQRAVSEAAGIVSSTIR